MANKPILSICIPTYNREIYLKECLDSIINQEGFNEQEIEIVISDNASKDNTTELVKEYQKKHKNIVYHRNNENIGPLKNILNLPNYANGEYVWFLSDDDILINIALKSVLQVIKKERPGLILSNYLGFNNIEEIDIKRTNTNGNITTVIGMENFFNFLGTLKYPINGYITLISLFCFKKSIYIDNIKKLLKENGKKYINILEKDNLPHSRVIFIEFNPQEKITLIEKNLVGYRERNASWISSLHVINDLFRLIKDIKKKYNISKTIYMKMIYIYYASVFTHILSNSLGRILPEKFYKKIINRIIKITNTIRALKHKIFNH